MSRTLLLVSMAAALAFAPSARAQNVCWTAIPSDGTLDEADAGELVFTGAVAQIDPALAPPQTTVIRYNVVAVDGALAGHTLSLRMNYVDAGSGGRIQARLKETDFDTGTTTTLITVDTNLFPQSAAAQTQFAETPFDACSGPAITNFNTKLYYVEVTLTQSAATALKLKGLKVCSGQHSTC